MTGDDDHEVAAANNEPDGNQHSTEITNNIIYKNKQPKIFILNLFGVTLQYTRARAWTHRQTGHESYKCCNRSYMQQQQQQNGLFRDVEYVRLIYISV